MRAYTSSGSHRDERVCWTAALHLPAVCRPTAGRVLVLVAFVPREHSEPRVFRPLLYYLALVRIGLPPAPVNSTIPCNDEFRAPFPYEMCFTPCASVRWLTKSHRSLPEIMGLLAPLARSLTNQARCHSHRSIQRPALLSSITRVGFKVESPNAAPWKCRGLPGHP